MSFTFRTRPSSGPVHLLLAACIAGAACMGAAHADSPDKPVRLVVSYAPGNVADIVARITAEALSAQWKQSVVVDNRPGQGGSLGAQVVAKAPADGYTLLFSAMAAFGINPHVYPSVGYDAKKDFAPIVGIVYPNGLLVANVEVKAKVKFTPIGGKAATSPRRWASRIGLPRSPGSGGPSLGTWP